MRLTISFLACLLMVSVSMTTFAGSKRHKSSTGGWDCKCACPCSTPGAIRDFGNAPYQPTYTPPPAPTTKSKSLHNYTPPSYPTSGYLYGSDSRAQPSYPQNNSYAPPPPPTSSYNSSSTYTNSPSLPPPPSSSGSYSGAPDRYSDLKDGWVEPTSLPPDAVRLEDLNGRPIKSSTPDVGSTQNNDQYPSPWQRQANYGDTTNSNPSNSQYEYDKNKPFKVPSRWGN